MIYIACPAFCATGGTELLHQLYSHLKIRTDKVKIYYTGLESGKNPIPESFIKYEVEWVDQISDVEGDVLIYPEVNAHLFSRLHRIKSVCWWLSADNYSEQRKILRPRLLQFMNSFLLQLEPNSIFSNKKITHLAQCNYTIDYLSKKGVVADYLSDYLNELYLNEPVEYSSNARENVVLYNPKKGIEYTRRIMQNAANTKFVPIENMSQRQIIDRMKSSKVYIDFGNHPGKDRIPREASIMGCIVIAGLRGSAKFESDLPIPETSKFAVRNSSLIGIVAKINEAFANYDNVISGYEEHRKMIRLEKSRFETDLALIWDKHIREYAE